MAEIISTFGEREIENPITITKKPTYSYGLVVNEIQGMSKHVKIGPITITLNLDFVLLTDILGISSFMLKIPSLPSIDLHLPSLPTINVVASIPVILPVVDIIAVPTLPTITDVLPSRPTVHRYPTEVNVNI
jgi:hypothetical protein